MLSIQASSSREFFPEEELAGRGDGIVAVLDGRGQSIGTPEGHHPQFHQGFPMMQGNALQIGTSRRQR